PHLLYPITLPPPTSPLFPYTTLFRSLMQVLPKTGRLLARQIKVRYTKNKLFEPDYNIELGMVYIANLVQQFGSPEAAAAAYNAGDRKSTRLNSSHLGISYAVFCLKKK